MNVAVRLLAAIVPVTSGYELVDSVASWGGDDHVQQTERTTTSLLIFVFAGLPCLYIVVKGVSFNPEGAANRRKGLRYIFAGVGVMVGAVAVSAFVTFVFSALVAPAIYLGVGLFATGAISVVAGLVAILTGHDMGDAAGDE